MIAPLILLSFFAIFPAGSEAPPRKSDSFNISIATDKSAFVRREPIPVRVTVTNETGHTIKTNSIVVSFQLTKLGKDSTDCRMSDCFRAPTYWAKEFKQGMRRTLEVDLTALYWNDAVLSGKDSRRHKNFYNTIVPGEYSLVLEFQFPDGRITSNTIVIRIELRKPETPSNNSLDASSGGVFLN